MARFQLSIVMVSLLLLQLLSLSLSSSTFTVTNNCTFTVWPGLLSGPGTPPLSTTGFALQPRQSASVPVPTSWSGRLWARTLCTQDPTTNKFTCITGDCGSGSIECSGSGAAPPATLAEFTLNGAGGLDFFDISLVDGFNLPMVIAPQGGTGANCKITGCVSDLNKACPEELKVTEAGMNGSDQAVACNSACEAFGEPQYCCSGEFSTPDKCKPSSYSMLFKNACPQAYSYAYDDGTSTFTCGAATEYDITFCPEPEPEPEPDTSSSFNGEIKMAANAPAVSHCIAPGFIGSAVFVVAVTWGLSQLL